MVGVFCTVRAARLLSGMREKRRHEGSTREEIEANKRMRTNQWRQMETEDTRDGPDKRKGRMHAGT